MALTRMFLQGLRIRRLTQQRLAAHSFSTPAEVVTWLGAVQAQDYFGAQWSLGLRLQHAGVADVEQAFTAGTILRTHVLRPTWHFVTPADIRWMLALTAPRVNAVNAYMYRRCELDAAVFKRTHATIARVVQGGRALTRSEIGAVLAKVGVVADGTRLSYILMRAELDALVCSGPRRGKQFTYMLLDERVPQTAQTPELSHDEALAELTRRYYVGRGPATVKDFVWWSGLSMADARAGLALAGADLAHEVSGDETYYFASSLLEVTHPHHSAFLLPTYDEYLVGYAAFGRARQGDAADECHESGENSSRARPLFDSTVVIDGQVAGSWRRTLSKNSVGIEMAPRSIADLKAVQAAAERYGNFLGLPMRLLPASGGV